MAKIADKDKVIVCPNEKCRAKIYVWKGQEEPTRCPTCGARL